MPRSPSSVRIAAVAVTAVLAVAVCACSSHSGGTSSAGPTARSAPPVPAASLGTPVIVPSTSPGALPSQLTPPAAVPPTVTITPTLSSTVLGPDGFGALRLGMTPAQAQATHLIGTPQTESGQTCATARLLAAPGVNTPSVFFSPTLGLAAIYAYSGITTPAGIAVGSTFTQLTFAYPTWRGLQGSEGVGYVPANGVSESEYRIAVSNGRVTQVALQLDAEDCYE